MRGRIGGGVYNRLISEQSTPAKKWMESRKDTGDEEKKRKIPPREREKGD